MFTYLDHESYDGVGDVHAIVDVVPERPDYLNTCKSKTCSYSKPRYQDKHWNCFITWPTHLKVNITIRVSTINITQVYSRMLPNQIFYLKWCCFFKYFCLFYRKQTQNSFWIFIHMYISTIFPKLRCLTSFMFELTADTSKTVQPLHWMILFCLWVSFMTTGLKIRGKLFTKIYNYVTWKMQHDKSTLS